MTTRHPGARLRRLLALPTWLATGAALCAQTAPTATRAPAATEETLVLSPFTVNTEKDRGYIAADSLLAGRLSTELLKTPSDITVLTRDFINDIGATDYLEASAYLTNTYATMPAGQDFGAQNNFRGLGGGFPTRNYFKHNNTLDFYNVERVRAPAAPTPSSSAMASSAASSTLSPSRPSPAAASSSSASAATPRAPSAAPSMPTTRSAATPPSASIS